MSVRRLAALLAIWLCLLLMGVPPAHADDDYLEFSDPAPHQELERVPGWVTLVFKTEATATLAKILVQDSAGRSVTTGPLIVEGSNVTTQLQSGLPKGTYAVYYRTADESGQPRGGAYQFSYGPGRWTTLDVDTWIGQTAEPTVIADPDPTASANPTVQSSPASGPETYTPQPSPDQTGTPAATPAPQVIGGVSGWIWVIGIVAVVAGVAVWIVGATRRDR